MTEASTAGIVSLVPSVTETLLAWGVVPAACTRFCEQPDLPHVGGTKNPDVEAIVALRPSLVVMCDEENRREDADALAAAGVPVHSCSPRSVAEVAPVIEVDGQDLFWWGARTPAAVGRLHRAIAAAVR